MLGMTVSKAAVSDSVIQPSRSRCICSFYSVNNVNKLFGCENKGIEHTQQMLDKMNYRSGKLSQPIYRTYMERGIENLVTYHLTQLEVRAAVLQASPVSLVVLVTASLTTRFIILIGRFTRKKYRPKTTN